MSSWSHQHQHQHHHHQANVVVMRKEHHAGSNDNTTGLVAMLSSAGLRGGSLDHSSPQQVTPSKRPLYATMLESLDESGDGEVADDSSGGAAGYSEKKRRLSAEQVRSLEMSFEMENRLEPVRKIQLAQELGLQPRQVAVWFQNRRARWKTKQLERDYDVLKAAYESLAEENTKLKAQLEKLTNSDMLDDTSLLKKSDEREEEEAEESGADKVDNLVPATKKNSTNNNNNKSSGVVEDEEACSTPDSPTVVSSKLKDSPSPDGYGSEVLDAFSPHVAAKSPLGPRQPASTSAASAVAQSVKEEPMTFPYKLDDDETLRGLESEASYNCLFGVSPEEEQGNWAWWDWS